MIFKDRVKENSTSSGTGNFTLSGADATFVTFNTAFGTGVPFCYTIVDSTNGAWEVGIGQLSAATTLVRTTVQAGSNGTSAVNFSAGAKVVFGSVNAVFMTNVPLVNESNTFTAGQRGAPTALSDAATVTPDFSVANNFTWTIGGNRTLANPTNLVAGQSGVITITQDGTGARTLAYGSYWRGTAQALSTTAGAVDNICYYVISSTLIDYVVRKGT